MSACGLLRVARDNRRPLILLLTPLVLSPIPLVLKSSAAKCLYAILILVVFWATEVVHLAYTSLLPIVLFPLLGLADSRTVCGHYTKDITFLVFASLMISVAVEKCNLHKRVALRFIMAIGTDPRWLLLGFTLLVFTFSMWMGNIAITSLMLPICVSVGDTLYACSPQETESTVNNGDPTDAMSKESNALVSISSKQCHAVDETLNPTCNGQMNDAEDAVENWSRDTLRVCHNVPRGAKRKSNAMDRENFRKATCLCVAYVASIAGNATIVGSGTNMVYKHILDEAYAQKSRAPPLTFTSWMAFAAPVALVCAVIAWLWLQIYFMGCRHFFKQDPESKRGAGRAMALIKRYYTALGPVKYSEVVVLCHFIVLACLWIFRQPGFMTGWSDLFGKGYLTDTTCAMAVFLSLSIFSAKPPKIFHFRRRPATPVDADDGVGDGSLLDWRSASACLPWGVLFLLGAAFAIAHVSKVNLMFIIQLSLVKSSGMIDSVASLESVFVALPPWALSFTINVIFAGITEFLSNTATLAVFTPWLITLADNLGADPVFLTFPATIASSFAFTLPISTGPNAIVFSYGYLKVSDMLKTGLVLNVLCVAVVSIAANTYGNTLFSWQTSSLTNASQIVNHSNSTPFYG